MNALISIAFLAVGLAFVVSLPFVMIKLEGRR